MTSFVIASRTVYIADVETNTVLEPRFKEMGVGLDGVTVVICPAVPQSKTVVVAFGLLLIPLCAFSMVVVQTKIIAGKTASILLGFNIEVYLSGLCLTGETMKDSGRQVNNSRIPRTSHSCRTLYH